MSTPAAGEHFVDDADPGDAHSSNETLLALLQRDGSASDRVTAKAKLAAMSPVQVAAYLRGKSPAEVLAVYPPYPGNGMIEMPKVFQDGTVLPDGDLMTRFASPDGWNRVPVMLGTNRDENRLFMFGDPHWVKRYFWIIPRLRNEPLYVATSEYLARNWKATGADMPAAAMRGNDRPRLCLSLRLGRAAAGARRRSRRSCSAPPTASRSPSCSTISISVRRAT